MTRLRILVSTTSLQNMPGRYQPMLERQAFDIVHARGPLDDGAMLDYAGDFDVILCG